MAQVTITVAGRAYRLGCDPGEEQHIGDLGRQLDARVSELRGQIGEVGDLRLLVMAGITLLDSLADARGEIEALQIEAEGGVDAATMAADKVRAAEEQAAQRVHRLAERLERLAAEIAEDTRQ